MPDNYIFLAELYRNIGDFETAKQTLSNLSDNSKKNQLLCEIELKNCEVITFQKAIQATFSY